MTEREIEIITPDGKSDAVLYAAEDGRRLPGVFFFTDIGGIRRSQREMAARLAAEGYIVLMPNLFYRSGRPPLFDFPLNFEEEQTTRRIGELSASLPPKAFERDAATYVDFLSSQPSVGPGPMGVVGYCFSGGLAMRIAAGKPERIAAAASFHGGKLVTDDPASPHLLLPRIKAQLYFGHAVRDRSMPQEAIDRLNDALAAWGGQYESEVYDRALHGWTVPDNPSYDHPQAERAFEKLKQLFKRALKDARELKTHSAPQSA
ncbi:MAG TPA: dienelactone hydrolase family protein [Bryobacteraceae bacterium]|jgi:carboxymethylenebutenolidase|nr:dienelactone hydrolase family protein [Bryobacteraceae bacterium]